MPFSYNKFVTAIRNYYENEPHRLKLTVGEVVIVSQECDEWYYGSDKGKLNYGIFPKAYVKLKNDAMSSEPLIQEMTSVLREWGHQWKYLYVVSFKNSSLKRYICDYTIPLFQTHSKHFTVMQGHILDLINYRKKMLCGTLTIDELKDVKSLATATIDTGNHILGLDMVVRDQNDNVLQPEKTSTIQLYYHHEKTAERIRKATSQTLRKPTKPQTPVYSHTLFVSVRNFVCKMTEDVELLLTLYDAKESRAISENYVVFWCKEGLARDIDQLHNLRVLFTDLGSRDLCREKVFLVCYVVRIGGMEVKEADNRRSSIIQYSPKTKSSENMRRPFGVAAMDITPYTTGRLEGDVDMHHFIPFMQ